MVGASAQCRSSTITSSGRSAAACRSSCNTASKSFLRSFGCSLTRPARRCGRPTQLRDEPSQQPCRGLETRLIGQPWPVRGTVAEGLHERLVGRHALRVRPSVQHGAALGAHLGGEARRQARLADPWLTAEGDQPSVAARRLRPALAQLPQRLHSADERPLLRAGQRAWQRHSGWKRPRRAGHSGPSSQCPKPTPAIASLGASRLHGPCVSSTPRCRVPRLIATKHLLPSRGRAQDPRAYAAASRSADHHDRRSANYRGSSDVAYCSPRSHLVTAGRLLPSTRASRRTCSSNWSALDPLHRPIASRHGSPLSQSLQRGVDLSARRGARRRALPLDLDVDLLAEHGDFTRGLNADPDLGARDREHANLDLRRRS